MKISIEEDSWCAEVNLFSQPNGFIHVEATSWGSTLADALSGAQKIIVLFGKGRTAYIRARPEAETDFSFAKMQIEHRGYVRFSFRLEKGEWHDREVNDAIPLHGFAHLQNI